MAKSSDQTLVLLDRILARMKHSDERLGEISRHVEHLKQSVEHLKQSTEEVMVAVACEESMFRLPLPLPCKEKPAFGLQQQPESGAAKVFDSRSEMRKCKEFLAQVSCSKSSPMSATDEDFDVVVGTLGAVIPTRCSTLCPDHNDGKLTATTTRASTLATGKAEVREERTKQVEGANESLYKMSELLLPGTEELVVNLQQPGNHATEVFDEMPQVIKLQQRQSQGHFMVLIRPIVVTNSPTMLVRECAIKEDLVNRGSTWYVWLSSMRYAARSGITSVTFCCHLPPNIVTARNDQDTRGIEDNGWPALEGKISEAQLVFEAQLVPWPPPDQGSVFVLNRFSLFGQSSFHVQNIGLHTIFLRWFAIQVAHVLTKFLPLYFKWNYSQAALLQQKLHKLTPATRQWDPVLQVNLSVATIRMSHQYGWNSSTAGLVQSSFIWRHALSQLQGGWLAKLFGGRRVLEIGVVTWSLATAITPVDAGFVPGLVLSRILVGIGEGVSPSAATDLIARSIPFQERSSAVAVVFGGLSFGSVLGLLFAPPIIQNCGIIWYQWDPGINLVPRTVALHIGKFSSPMVHEKTNVAYNGMDIGLGPHASFVIKEVVQLFSADQKHLVQEATCYSVQLCLGEMSVRCHCKLLYRQGLGQLHVPWFCMLHQRRLALAVPVKLGGDDQEFVWGILVPMRQRLEIILDGSNLLPEFVVRLEDSMFQWHFTASAWGQADFSGGGSVTYALKKEIRMRKKQKLTSGAGKRVSMDHGSTGSVWCLGVKSPGLVT